MHCNIIEQCESIWWPYMSSILKKADYSLKTKTATHDLYAVHPSKAVIYALLCIEIQLGCLETHVIHLHHWFQVIRFTTFGVRPRSLHF